MTADFFITLAMLLPMFMAGWFCGIWYERRRQNNRKDALEAITKALIETRSKDQK